MRNCHLHFLPRSRTSQYSRRQKTRSRDGLQTIARKNRPSAHDGYLMTGVDDDATIRANREGYGRIQLRVRRLGDVRIPDTSASGLKMSVPRLTPPSMIVGTRTRL